MPSMYQGVLWDYYGPFLVLYSCDTCVLIKIPPKLSVCALILDIHAYPKLDRVAFTQN